MKQSAYDRVTERIINLLDKGVCPWRRPWNRLNIRPKNFASDRHYSGINWFLLEALAFDLPLFMTFKQVKSLGGFVSKGSQGIPVVYWGTFEKQDNSSKEDEPKKIPFLRYYTVFNAQQIEGIDFPDLSPEKPLDFEPILEAEKIHAGWSDGPTVDHGHNRACYIPAQDRIQMPPKIRFSSAEDYYSTLFHEMGHATGACHRLNRKTGNQFGDTAYSREELVAEMTAAFLCARCGIDNSVIENSTAYLKGWIKVLKGDSKLVVTAASQAQKAANLILGEHSPEKKE